MSGSLRDVLPSVAAALGVPGAPDTLGLAERLGDRRRTVLVLVDGLGRDLLPRLAAHAPLLASVLGGTTGSLAALTAPFPSTTPTSLVTLGTGRAPGEHGILGFTVRIPGTDRVLTHVRWRDDPPVAAWAPLPTWFARAASAGIRSRVVLPAAFVGSGLSEAAYGGAEPVAVAEGQDYAAQVVAEAHAGTPLVYGYTATLDTAAHVHGIASPEWADAAAQVDALLTRILESLPADTALVVTADHGGLDVPPDHRVDAGTTPALTAGVEVIAGEPRARHVYAAPGATADVHAAWRETLGARAEVLLREEAVARGLFGPVAPRHLPRLGDVIAIARGDHAVMATDREPAAVSDLVGMHGALSPAETTVPLIVVA